MDVDTGNTGLGDASGTIDGWTDNYVVKISKDAESDMAFRNALEKKYGNIEDFRYYAMDISLYDSTGTKKIEDPEGVTATLTVPIPEELALYGGNNKVATVDKNGNLEDLSTRFTTIDGSQCAVFTAPHFSPYGFYVNVKTLGSSQLDPNPKTADPINPKWFLAAGLAALSIFLFLKKDPKPKVRRA